MRSLVISLLGLANQADHAAYGMIFAEPKVLRAAADEIEHLTRALAACRDEVDQLLARVKRLESDRAGAGRA